MSNITTDFNDKTIEYKQLLDDFKQLIKKKNLKFTIQREVILETLYNLDEHLT
ncbi:MAG: Fur family transcriptional regulator, ferric uptake regulator, partial [Campylobacterota bacterium]|nr:Fur family transcriptional regulator, ferric uptake regulator [Campylobacterota bacterium]